MAIGVILCLLYLLRLYEENIIELAFSAFAITSITLLYVTVILLNLGLWRILVFALTGKTLTIAIALAGTASLMIGKYLPGKVFALIGRASSVSAQVSRPDALGATFLEQAYLVAGFVVLSLLVFAMQSDHVYWAPVLVVLSAFMTVYFPVFLGKMLAGFGHPRLQFVGSWLRRLTPATSLKLSACAVSAAMTMASIAWFSVDLLGLEVTPEIRLGIVYSYALGVTAGLLAIVVPGGIGVREASFILFAQQWVGLEESIAIAALLRMINVIVDLAMGILGLFLAKRLKNQSSSDSESALH